MILKSLFSRKKTNSSKADFPEKLDTLFEKLEALLAVIGEVLRPIGEHAKAVGTVSAFATAVAGFIVLKTYSMAIGRPDLLTKVVDKTFTGLLPWILLVALFVVLYAFVMLSATILYALAVSYFNVTQARSRVAVLLLLPVWIGSMVFVGFIFQAPEMDMNLVMALVVSVTLAAALCTLFSATMRYALSYVALFNNIAGLGKLRYRAGLFILTCWLINCAVFSAVYPAAMLLRSYSGEDTPQGVNILMGITMLAVTLLFLPALTFFLSKQHVARRSLRSLVIAFGIVFGVILGCPGAGSTIVYISASAIGVRGNESGPYRLLKNFKTQDFKDAWGTVNGAVDAPVVSAFPLFALGDVLLLCPSSLSETKLREWTNELSRSCILTQNSDVTKLPVETPNVKGYHTSPTKLQKALGQSVRA